MCLLSGVKINGLLLVSRELLKVHKSPKFHQTCYMYVCVPMFLICMSMNIIIFVQ